MKSLIGAVVGVSCLAVSAAAQVPVAIVEDVQGKVDGVEFMDYVASGKVIKLAPKATLVLGYLKSCWRETITGGTAIVGAEQSVVHLGDIQRVKVDCDANGIQLPDSQANQSAATTFRGIKPDRPAAAPQLLTLYGISPVVEVKGGGVLIIERVDVPGERYTVPLKASSLVRGKFYDFAKAKMSLKPGGTYVASVGPRKTTFMIDAHAIPGSTPIVGRLLRVE